jgi:thermitase
MSDHNRRLLIAALAPLAMFSFSPARALADGAVLYSPTPAAATAAIANGLSSTQVTGLRIRRVQVKGDPQRVATALGNSRRIAWAEPDRAMHILAEPLRRSQWALDSLHVEKAWAFAGLAWSFGLSGAPIGIVDTGIDTRHEEFRGRLRACAASASGRVREGICDDREGHGSHVAGIAAGNAGNGLGIAGIAGASPILACRALSGTGAGSTSDVAACIVWLARSGAKVINLSIGGPDSAALRTAVRTATSAGSLLVAAAGNDGSAADSWPAAYPEVISVAALDPNGQRASYSNWNRDIELAAPGTGILSVKNGGGYARMSGTSMAAPEVAGAAALIWNSVPGKNAVGVRSALDHAARDVGARGRDPKYGFGSLDLALLG